MDAAASAGQPGSFCDIDKLLSPFDDTMAIYKLDLDYACISPDGQVQRGVQRDRQDVFHGRPFVWVILSIQARLSNPQKSMTGEIPRPFVHRMSAISPYRTN